MAEYWLPTELWNAIICLMDNGSKKNISTCSAYFDGLRKHRISNLSKDDLKLSRTLRVPNIQVAYPGTIFFEKQRWQVCYEQTSFIPQTGVIWMINLEDTTKTIRSKEIFGLRIVYVTHQNHVNAIVDMPHFSVAYRCENKYAMIRQLAPHYVDAKTEYSLSQISNVVALLRVNPEIGILADATVGDHFIYDVVKEDMVHHISSMILTGSKLASMMEPYSSVILTSERLVVRFEHTLQSPRIAVYHVKINQVQFINFVDGVIFGDLKWIDEDGGTFVATESGKMGDPKSDHYVIYIKETNDGVHYCMHHKIPYHTIRFKTKRWVVYPDVHAPTIPYARYKCIPSNECLPFEFVLCTQVFSESRYTAVLQIYVEGYCILSNQFEGEIASGLGLSSDDNTLFCTTFNALYIYNVSSLMNKYLTSN